MAGKLILFVGLPASGKTTYWKRHFRDKGIIRLSMDSFQKMVTGRDYSPAFMGIAKVWLDWTHEYLLREGHSILIDTTSLTKNVRERLVRLATNCKAQIITYWFDIPLEICMDRNRYRERVVPDAVMQRMSDQFEPPDPEEGFDKLWRVEVDGEKYEITIL